MRITANQTLSRTLRVLIGAVGGYAFTNGYIAFVGALLPRLGLATGEAVAFAVLSGILVFLGIVILATATASPVRTTAVIAVAATAMIFGAPLLVSG